jgi:TonB family protein
MKKIGIIITLLLLFVLAGCTKNTAQKQLTKNTAQKQLTKNTAQKQLTFKKPNSAPMLKDQGLYGFSINMLGQVMENTNENVVCSPFGVAALFRMMADGASEQTLKELEQIICVDSKTMSEMTKDLAMPSEDDKALTFEIANILVLNNGFTLIPKYKQDMKTRYLSEVRNMNFALPSSTKKLNEWVSEHTHGLIRNGVGKLDPKEVFRGINTVYLKGYWLSEFDKGKTATAAFHNLDGTLKTVSMMYNEEMNARYQYCNNSAFQAVAIPYKGRSSEGKMNHFSMYVLLPHKDKRLTDVYTYLQRHKLEDLKQQMKNTDIGKVHLWLPKFEVKSSLNVLNILFNLGFKHLNQFVRMSNKPVILSASTQKATIDVNEEYTEAAAMTMVTAVGCMNIEANPTKDYYFRADRPFIYLIVNEETNTILFMGQYTQGMIKKGNEWKSVNYEGKVSGDIPLETTSNSRSSEEGEVTKVPFTDTKTANVEKVYDVVEQMPSFPGGYDALSAYIKDNLKYPPEHIESCIQGRVVVCFIVEKDGSTSNIKVVKSIEPALDKEAIRLTKSMPRWNPGKQNGQVVRVKYYIPVIFRQE